MPVLRFLVCIACAALVGWFAAHRAATQDTSAPQTVAMIAELNAISPHADGALVLVQGYRQPADGGGGAFVFRRNSTMSPDTGTVVSGRDGIGRWIRIHAGTANVRWFGAYGDGVHDDTPAIRLALRTVGGGARGTVYLPAGVYRVTASLTLGAGGEGLARPIAIVGDGQATQIVNDAPPGTPTLAIRGVSYWSVRNLAITGNSTHPNDGLLVEKDASGHQSARFVIDNVVTEVAGRGLVLRDCNTAVIRGCGHWPSSDSHATATFPQVNLPDISHGIYLTGDFCNDVSIYDYDCQPSARYAPGMCAICCDAKVANSVRIINGDMEGESTAATTAIRLSNCSPFIVSGVFAANAAMFFSNCSFGTLESIDQEGATRYSELQFTGDSNRCRVDSHHGGRLLIDPGCYRLVFNECEFDAGANAVIDSGNGTRFQSVSQVGVLLPDK